MGRKAQFISITKDIPILEFLWQWKTATTAMFVGHLAGNLTGAAAYKRLQNLAAMGIIQCRSDHSGHNFTWCLTALGFSLIENRLPGLKERGFASEALGHDLCVTAVHLGDWIAIPPDGCSTFSEQQLRRYELEFYPAWVPKTMVHRPDGYWKINDGNLSRLIALEVELSWKRDREILAVADFYENLRDIFLVVWVVPTLAFGESMAKKIGQKTGSSAEFHNFFHLSAVQSQGWQALAFSGSRQGESLAKILGSETGPGGDPGPAAGLFNGRKKDLYSARYGPFDPRHFH
jgi:hypothetical protein